MKFWSTAALLMLAVSAHSMTVKILSEHLYPIAMSHSTPIKIDDCQLLESGEMRISLFRDFNFIRPEMESWTIVLDSTGCPVLCEESDPDYPLIFRTSQLGESTERWLIALSGQGDTVWTCLLEGTNEFHATPHVTRLPDGGCLIHSSPDRYQIYTEIYSLSSTGEMICHYSLGTDYLLDLPEPIGENNPNVRFLGKTSSGDILAGGGVYHIYDDPQAWFVCLLDGDTGNPLWKTTGLARGTAFVSEAIETSSGLIVFAGNTARCSVSEDSDEISLDVMMPFIAALDSTGELQELVVLDAELADVIYGIVEVNPLDSEFLITGRSTTSGKLVLLRVSIYANQEN